MTFADFLGGWNKQPAGSDLENLWILIMILGLPNSSKKTAIEYAKHMHEQAKHEWVQVLGYIHIAHLPSFDGGCSEHLILQVWTRWKPVGTGYGPMGFFNSQALVFIWSFI